MADTTPTPTPVAPPAEIVSSDNGMNWNAMKELSLEQTVSSPETMKEIYKKKASVKEGGDPASTRPAGRVPAKAPEPADPETGLQSVETEETYEEESAPGSSGISDDVSNDGDAEATEDEESKEEVEEEKEATPRKLITLTKEDGEAVEIPQDAIVEVKVDGKIHKMPLRTVLDRASGATHLQQRHESQSAREKQWADFEVQRQQHYEQVQENTEILNHLAENGHPEDFLQYYGMLTGKDPNQIMQNMVARIVNYVETHANMTERERQLERANREHNFRQSLSQYRAKKEAVAQERTQLHQQISEELSHLDLTWDDFNSAIEEVKYGLAEGKFTGQWNAFDIVDYASRKKLVTTITDHANMLNKDLATKDPAFVNDLVKAVALAEQQTGERFSQEEISELVKQSWNERIASGKKLVEKKAARQSKSGRSPNLKKQPVTKAPDGGLTLNDHRRRLLERS